MKKCFVARIYISWTHTIQGPHVRLPWRCHLQTYRAPLLKGSFFTERHFCVLLFSCSVSSGSMRPHRLAWQTSVSFTIFWSLLKLISIKSVTNYPTIWPAFLLLLLSYLQHQVCLMSRLLHQVAEWIGISPTTSDHFPKNIQIDFLKILGRSSFPCTQGLSSGLLQNITQSTDFFSTFCV